MDVTTLPHYTGFTCLEVNIYVITGYVVISKGFSYSDNNNNNNNYNNNTVIIIIIIITRKHYLYSAALLKDPALITKLARLTACVIYVLIFCPRIS